LSFAEQSDSLSNLLAEIKDNAHRIQAIVDDLKHLGKKDPGELNAAVDINAAIKAAASIKVDPRFWTVV
jgi:phosphoglycerate-specific signal transduction histidine kinase